MKKIITVILIGLVVLTGCANMSQTAKGSLIGSGGGAALGAAVGALIGNGQGAAIGAAIGTAVGAGAGALIGNKMDKKAEELAEIEGAEVETVTDTNGLEAIKVTFESGILFPTNGITLSSASKAALTEFASKMTDLQETNIQIYGHTDNTGTAAVNERISTQRAQAVETFLTGQGIAKSRIESQGMSYNMPVADNATAEGRAQNRRVEIFITANEIMIKQAETGELK